MDSDKDHTVKTTYFYRFYVPLMVSMLLLFAIGVIIVTPPGTKIKWDGYPSAFNQSIRVAAR